MTRNIKLTIEYDGTHFNGWQTQTARKRQRGQTARKPPRTVQGEMEVALKKIFGRDLKLVGSGRTDSGVHAVGQVANFKVHSPMPPEEIRAALNANLPDDIAVLKAEEVPLVFHAQYSVKSKTYRYTVLNRDVRCALQRNFCLFYPRKLNVRAMRHEAKSLVGRKDFKSFTACDPAARRDRKTKDTVRTVKRLDITRKGDFLLIDIEADGFLYKMVRNIVGTLLEAGRGRLAEGGIKQILAKKDRNAAAHTAKSRGLTLLEVRY